MNANPPEAYRTWIMGVQRTLLRTGHDEAAWHVSQYDRDLKGVYLSGASPSEGAKVVSRRWQGGYNENRFAPSGPMLLVSSVLFGGVLLYLALRPKTAATSATGRYAPRSSETIPGVIPTPELPRFNVGSPADLFMV